MDMKTTKQNDIVIVLLEGQMDTNTSPKAESHLNELRDSGSKKIILNFKQLDFISSAGLRVLLATAQELKNSGGELRVCHLNEDVQEVFDISGFSTLLNVFDSKEGALEGF